MILPAQAVKCRLAHLKPAGSVSHTLSLSLSLTYYLVYLSTFSLTAQRWSMQASSLLFQMTKDKPIVAILSAVVVSSTTHILHY